VEERVAPHEDYEHDYQKDKPQPVKLQMLCYTVGLEMIFRADHYQPRLINDCKSQYELGKSTASRL
jgi:hypothetical protein